MPQLVVLVEKIIQQDACPTNFRSTASDRNSSISRKPSVLVKVCQFILVFVLTSDYFKFADSLRFTSIQMPALVQRGTNFWLSCQYELAKHATLDDNDVTGVAGSTNEQLYSVKWYKNNEEFYRLIFTSGGANQQPPTSFGSDGQQQEQQQEQPQHPFGTGQQQCFTQPGVNVLMSSSNATHVRLLNASLETDGSYACEISTQNLSTIRFEKEIKVYVLPSSKLNLIGLRGLYSLGDRVELNCLSDFSRPAAAISWFINGRRVITTGPSARFQLEPQLTKPKANEPKLTRSSLALKFKLTNEILAGAASSSQAWDLFERIANSDNNDSSTQTTTTSNKRNQSKLLLLKSFNGNTEQPTADNSRRLSTSTSTGLRLVELLKLECRYKLTEVSDVTFSELRVASNEQPAPTSGVDGAHPVAATTSGDLSGLIERKRRKRRRAPASTRRWPTTSSASSSVVGDVVGQQQQAGASGHNSHWRPGLAKSLTNQVHQTSCPARRNELAALLAATSRAAAACRWGLLALQREDPVILEPVDEERDDDEEATTNAGHKANDRLAGASQLKQLPVGSTIAINCSTLGALSFATNSRQQSALVNDSVRRRRLRPTSDYGDQEERNNDAGQQSVIYCDDIEARKRLLVSGKYQDELHWNEWPTAVSPNQRHKSSLLAKHKRHHVAYVSFEATRMNSSAATIANNGRRQQQARTTPLGDHDNKLSLSNLNGAADSSNFHQLEGALKSLDQLHNNVVELDSTTTTTTSNSNKAMQQSAPPLLEWFINNQEAPKSSASYWPELPLTTSAGRQQVASYANHDQPSRLQEPDNEYSTQLPSIDYREYFANFDARTNDQHLMLRLTLEKKHFMTPDSLLKLRCTSTQAEVLAVDSLEVSLYAIPAGANISADQANQQQERHTSSSNWHQRSTSNQIKSKYLHRQQLAKSAGQQGLNANSIEQQRHLHARPTTAASGASSTRLMWSIWTLQMSAVWALFVTGFKIVQPDLG